MSELALFPAYAAIAPCRHIGVTKFAQSELDFVKQKRKRLELNVYVKNKRAVQFYEREGFCIQREGKDAETGEKEYCMLWIK